MNEKKEKPYSSLAPQNTISKFSVLILGNNEKKKKIVQTEASGAHDTQV